MAEEKTAERKFPDDYLRFDTKDALHTILSLPHQMREGYELAKNVRLQRPFSRVVVAGMGGSGIAGQLLKMVMDSDEECTVPVTVACGYDAPREVDKDTLLVAVTYSGNTEETLSAYKMAVRKGCQSVLVSSGGKAEELASINKHPHVKVPRGLEPRMALGYLFFPLLRIMHDAGVLKAGRGEVDDLADSLGRQDLRGQAVELSAKCYERIPLVWADGSFWPVAYRWKTQFNENAKTPAFWHEFSELNHNEIMAFSNRPAGFHAIILSTDRQHRRVAKRIGLTKDIVQRRGVSVTEIGLKGSLLKQVFSAILLGDLTSYYLALRYETDPSVSAIIEDFKKDLGPFLI